MQKMAAVLESGIPMLGHTFKYQMEQSVGSCISSVKMLCVDLIKAQYEQLLVGNAGKGIDLHSALWYVKHGTDIEDSDRTLGNIRELSFDKAAVYTVFFFNEHQTEQPFFYAKTALSVHVNEPKSRI